MGIELVAIAIDCEWAEPMARFYEGLLGFEIRDLGPRGRWAQLFNPKCVLKAKDDDVEDRWT
jgi:hypothetical protein